MNSSNYMFRPHTVIIQFVPPNHWGNFCLNFLREIRHEVSFLAMLDHPNLTKLCGVRTSPYMCLLLELAPRGSLRGILKQYKKYGSVLEPLTLQLSIAQVCY